MDQKQIITGLVCSALGFAVGLTGGAIINRPSRQNYDSKIADIQSESWQAKQLLDTKLHQAQEVIQELQKNIGNLTAELNKVKHALTIADQKKQEAKVEIVRNDAAQNNGKNQSKYEESDEAWNLRIQDKLNLENILFKLGFLAIENDTIDTREYHNHLNKLKDNHQFRLKIIQQYDQLGGFAELGIYETFFNGQEQIRQRKVEALKIKDIHAFDLIEEIEQEMYRAHLKTIKKHFPQHQP